MTVGSFTFTISVPSTTVPSWFANLTPMSWLPVAITGTLEAAWPAADYVWPTDPNDPISPPAGSVTGPKGDVLNSGDNYCRNSNGMAVDPLVGDCFLVSNGGHAGYFGNETMRLNLRTEVPAWERWVDSTPPWQVSATGISVHPDETPNGTFSYHCYADGPAWTTDYVAEPTYQFQNNEIQRRPFATHTSCLPTYSEGQVWLALQNSTNCGGGSSSFAKTSLNVAMRRQNPGLKFWKYGDIRPWEYHGIMIDAPSQQPRMSQSNFLFPTSALDPTTGRIWTCPGTSSGMKLFWMLETRGPNAGRHQTFVSSTISLRTDNAMGGGITCDATGFGPSALVDTNGAPLKLFILYGRRLFARDVFVLNITNLEAQHPTITYSGVLSTDAWNQYLATDATPMLWINSYQFTNLGKDSAGTWGPQQAWGAFWHEGSQGLLMFNCDHAVDNGRQRNGNLRKLALPLNPQGRYDPVNASWRYHNIATSGVVPTTCMPNASGLVLGGSFSRFNVMRSFDGIGNDLAVSVNSWSTATSVMKIPQSGV